MRIIPTFSLLMAFSFFLSGCGLFDLVSHPFKSPSTAEEKPVIHIEPQQTGNESVAVEELPPPVSEEPLSPSEPTLLTD